MKFECANCHGHVEMDSYGGQAVVCPHCHVASHFLLLQTTAAAALQRPGSGAVIGGWVCFLLAVVFVFLPFPTFYIYGPLALVAFILGIVAIAQRRLGQGLGILLSSIIGLPILILISWLIGLAVIGKGVAASAKAAAFSTYSEDAKKGEPDAMYNLGRCYIHGFGCAVDTNQAIVWFEKAAAKGNTNAIKELTMLKPDWAAAK